MSSSRDTSTAMNRRQFFNLSDSREETIVPPGALPHAEFIKVCNGCGDCVGVCPRGVVQINGDKLPELDLRHAGCSFCGLCGEVCNPAAIAAKANIESMWPWRARVSLACLDRRGVACRACESACEHDAICFRPALGGTSEVMVSLDQCDGCGACLSKCPVVAIDLFKPDAINQTIRKNAA